MLQVKEMCIQHKIKFKLNSVINAYNWNEDMNSFIEDLQPARWKCFQVLILNGENAGDG